MGILKIPERLLRCEQDVSTLSQIGAMPAWARTTATRIVPGDSGPRFGEEVPVDFEFAVRPKSDGEGLAVRIEIKTSDRTLRGAIVTAVQHPWSLRTLVQAEFKAKRYTSRSPRPDQDPFEAGKFETAGLDELTAFVDDVVSLDAYDDIRRLRRASWNLGLCDDRATRDACVRSLQESAAYRDLVMLTETRTLRFTHGDARGENVWIRAEILEQCLEFLGVAPLLAFGGPGDKTGFAGGEVAALLEYIYKGHVNMLNRRHAPDSRPVDERDGV